MRGGFNYGICGVDLGTKFAYPGESNALNAENYVFYSRKNDNSFTRDTTLSMARRVRHNGGHITGGVGSNGCVTCFRTFAGACTPIRVLQTGFARTLGRPGVIVLSVTAEPSYLPGSIITLLSRLGGVGPISIRLNLRAVRRDATGCVHENCSLRICSRTIGHLETRGVSIIARLVVKLPGRDGRSVLRDITRTYGTNAGNVGLRLLRVLGNASLTGSCTTNGFGTLRFRRCLRVVRSYIRVVPSGIIVRHLANSKTGGSLVTPL